MEFRSGSHAPFTMAPRNWGTAWNSPVFTEKPLSSRSAVTRLNSFSACSSVSVRRPVSSRFISSMMSAIVRLSAESSIKILSSLSSTVSVLSTSQPFNVCFMSFNVLNK